MPEKKKDYPVQTYQSSFQSSIHSQAVYYTPLSKMLHCNWGLQEKIKFLLSMILSKERNGQVTKL